MVEVSLAATAIWRNDHSGGKGDGGCVDDDDDEEGEEDLVCL